MDLAELKQKLLTMASHAETAINEALRALVERDYDLALRVKESDSVIDQLEVEIDDMAIHLLAKAPLASDLRLVTVAMKRQGAWLNMSVTDNGIGMVPEAVARVGEAFFQVHEGLARRYEGTGLGLSIVKGLVDLHEGTLRVTSEASWLESTTNP